MNSSGDKVSVNLNSGGTDPGGGVAAGTNDATAMSAATTTGTTTTPETATTTEGATAVAGTTAASDTTTAEATTAAGAVTVQNGTAITSNGTDSVDAAAVNTSNTQSVNMNSVQSANTVPVEQAGNSVPGQVGATPVGVVAPLYTNPAMESMATPAMNPNLMSSHFGPISSGTGDIMIANDENRNPKKWLVLGGAAIAILIIVLIIFLVMRMAGGSSAGSSDLRSAFNIYANYFLTGEAKDEDLPEVTGFETETINEEDTADSIRTDAQGDYVPQGGANESSVDDVYFYQHVGAVFNEEEDDKEYKEKILAYFKSFLKSYTDAEKVSERNDEGEMVDLVEDYGKKLELVLEYDGAPNWSELALWEVYRDGGKSGLEEYVKKMSEPFKDLGVVNGKNYYELLLDYGEKYLDLLPKYEEMGCLTNEGVDYTCAEEKKDANSEALEEVVSRDYSDLVDLIDKTEGDLYTELFDIKNEVYSYGNDGIELIDVEENGKESADVEEE